MRLHRVSNSVLALGGGGAVNTAINAAWGLSFGGASARVPPSPRLWSAGARAGGYHTIRAVVAQKVSVQYSGATATPGRQPASPGREAPGSPGGAHPEGDP